MNRQGRQGDLHEVDSINEQAYEECRCKMAAPLLTSLFNGCTTRIWFGRRGVSLEAAVALMCGWKTEEQPEQELKL